MREWTPKAELYDFGRPFPEHQVTKLFGLIDETYSSRALKVFEPGSGTGRILLPLAKRYSNWNFFGIDSSASSLAVCRQRCFEQNINNIEACKGSLPDDLPKNSFDMIIHSSVLHVVPIWQKVMAQLLNCLNSQGIFCLVGDYGDIYDAALGRELRDGIEPGLEKFWGYYLELRKKLGVPDTESSQTGCKWDLESSELAAWLEQNGFKEFKTSRTSWEQVFSVESLMRIVEERCYSSMFTVELKIYQKIIDRMKANISSLNLEDCKSRHQAVARFFKLED